MEDDLVTAAVFGDHTNAVAARIHLEEAGIPAFLSGELLSDALFGIGAAANGISVQVPASRLAEAVRLIDDRLPGHAAPVNWSEVDVGQPEPGETIEDEGAPPERRADAAPSAAAVEETEPTDLTLREQRANRLVRGALIGILVWPVLVLAVWRLIQIANSEERLRPEYQRKANIGAIIVGVPLLVIVLVCCGVSAAQLGRW